MTTELQSLLDELEKAKSELDFAKQAKEEAEFKLRAFYKEHGQWKAISKYPTYANEETNFVVCEHEDFVSASQLLIRKLLQHDRVSPDRIYYQEGLERVEFIINGAVFGYLEFEED